MVQEKTMIKGLGFCGNEPFAGANAAAVDVQDGKIVRIRPLHFDWKYKPQEMNPWKIRARGKVFEPGMKTLLPPFSLGYKKRVFSPNRILYPLKRVDWNPDGDRNTQNRGQSKFVRISWDEAANLIAAELRRVKDTYGPSAVLALRRPGHGETKVLHFAHGANTRLFHHYLGDFTDAEGGGPDSWEGWHWGAKHVWGMRHKVGLMVPITNCIKDISENSGMVLFWGCDPETTPLGWGGQQVSRICYWWSELGIKSVYVCPDLNYGAAIHADKWIPVLPNTDAALHLAISYIWMTEGTYDQEYLKTHTYGYEKYSEYVLGKEDGIPKTPAWAAPLCGVPEWTIKALARQWASMATSITHGNGGSYIRGPYSHEPARLEVLNLAMQGLGKPGRHQVSLIEWNHFGFLETNPMPRPKVLPNLGKATRGGLMGGASQLLPRHLLAESIISDKPVSWYGSSMPLGPIEDQFHQNSYPAKDHSKIRLIWSDMSCWAGCWDEGNKVVEAMGNPQIECVIVQHQWMENGCLYADLILPVNTKLEEEDLGTDVLNGQFSLIFKEEKCIEPLGESKSDFEAVGEVAKKLGVYQQLTENKTDDEWIRMGFETSGVQKLISWEEFQKKGYFVVPTAEDWEQDPVGLSQFVKDPEGNSLQTPTGKIEFYSTALAKHFPDDEERKPVPQWIPYGESLQESRLHPRAKKYPLILVSNHPKWRVHAQHDDMTWLREVPMCKVKGPDGYLYETVWINPQDAAARGIKDGNIVKIFNDRGAVLGGAFITERIISGAVSQDHGARLDPIAPGLDRGGSNNMISPHGWISRNCLGVVTSGFLVEIEKVSLAQMEEWKKQYPDAFARLYEPGSGLLFKAWITQ